jgi:hypothetical protein
VNVILALALAISIGILLVILYFVRNRVLKEQYALLWLGFGVIMILLSVNSTWLNVLARLFGVYYAPSLLFLFGIIFCLLLILHLTIIISKLSDRVVRLVQEVSLLKKEIQNKE